MKYEFRGKDVESAVAMALRAKRASPLLVKSSDSGTFDAGQGRSVNYRLYINAQAFTTYTVSWDAYSPADGSDYVIELYTGVGLGSYKESFSSSGSWSFNTGDYSGDITIYFGLLFAYTTLRARPVYVEVS